MNTIPSFKIDHTKLLPGVYVSRKDRVGDNVITTFDLRITRPNYEPTMGTDAIHAIEHLAATYLRNVPNWRDKVIYFGPMGCRTGFYLIVAGDYTSDDIMSLVDDCFRFIATFEGPVPGASAVECGNYLDMNLPMARWWSTRYWRVIHDARVQTKYPE